MRWRRAFARARAAVYRVAGFVEPVIRRGDPSLPLPPLQLRMYYYGSAHEAVYRRACESARTELILRGLRPDSRVLDVGCGIGNLAVGLLGYLRGGYVGLDIHREAIDWCQKAITPHHPGFEFHFADVASEAYNAGGRMPAGQMTFPVAARSIDFVFLGSVFTHLLPDAVEHYTREIGRVLAPGGLCVASYFLLNDDTRPDVEAGRSFMSFAVAHPSGLCRLHDAATPEAAVALEEAFIQQTCAAAQLRIRDIRRGHWARGGRHDQDVITIETLRS